MIINKSFQEIEITYHNMQKLHKLLGVDVNLCISLTLIKNQPDMQFLLYVGDKCHEFDDLIDVNKQLLHLYDEKKNEKPILPVGNTIYFFTLNYQIMNATIHSIFVDTYGKAIEYVTNKGNIACANAYPSKNELIDSKIKQLESLRDEQLLSNRTACNHVSDGMIYPTFPPKRKCIFCHQWYESCNNDISSN